jgi:antirestriction protein
MTANYECIPLGRGHTGKDIISKTEAPQIYVACLASYNRGTLHGAWINAAQNAEKIEVEVKAMIETSPEPDADEWAIHDTSGFEGISINEWESFEKVSELAEAIKEHGEAYAAFYNNNCGDDFEDAYRGQWDNFQNFADELANEMGAETKAEYFFYGGSEGFAKDLQAGGDYRTAPATPYGVHVFANI